MNHRHLIGVLAIAAVAAGCVTASHTPSSAAGKNDDEVAIVRSETVNSVGTEIVAVTGEQGPVLKYQIYTSYREVRLEPGHYIVRFLVGVPGKRLIFPDREVRIRAGYTYSFRAVPIMDAQAVRLDYHVQTTAAAKASRGVAPEWKEAK
jgi:hypothetical protein